MIFEFKYPAYRACSVFDNSPVHKARGASGLSASDMNLKPGGAQPHQRDTEYTDHGNLHGRGAEKKYRKAIGQKGLRSVLSERGVNVGTKTKKELVEILEKYDDFSKDDFWLDRIFAARPVGHVCIFAPKCHPELQGPIEMCWARVKYYCARHSNHTLVGLQAAIPGAFSADNISLYLVQKWFRKGRDYMTVYKQGATGQSADKAQKTRPPNPRFPFPRFPIWPGNGEGFPVSRFGRNRETGNPRFPIRPGTGNGAPRAAGRGFGRLYHAQRTFLRLELSQGTKTAVLRTRPPLRVAAP